MESFETLPTLDPTWLQVIQTAKPYRFDLVIFSFLGLVPVVQFLSAWYLSRLEKKHLAETVSRESTYDA